MDPPPPPLSLDALPAAVLQHILQSLPSTAHRRLAATCTRLRQASAEGVGCLRLTQDDMENDHAESALAAFPRVQRLVLDGLTWLDADFPLELESLAAPVQQLLQGLTSLQITSSGDLKLDTDLLHLLASCPQLSELCLKGCSWDDAVETGGLRGTAAQPKPPLLRRLSLQRNAMLREAQLLELLSAPDCGSATLDAVELPEWCRALWHNTSSSSASASSSTSMAAMPLPAWQHLSDLDLSACLKLGANLGPILALCPRLERLSLHSCFKLIDATLEELCMTLSRPRSSSEGSALAAGPSSSASCSQHSSRPPLRHLDLSYTRVQDAGMQDLVAALPNLAGLGVKGCNVGDDGLLALLQLQHLTALHIKHCHRVTEEGIQSLSSLSRLAHLSYGFTSMPEADDVAALIGQQFAALTALDLLASELTDTGLRALDELSHLQQLRLYQAGVTAEGLQELAQQPAGTGLRSLVLYGTGALRELSCLGAFPRLQELQLGSLCDLSARMAAALVALTAVQPLTSLTLERMDGLTVPGLVRILQGCQQLQVLSVRGCDGVCLEDMEELACGGGSSARVRWAAAPSCDTDDEDEGWEEMPPC